MTDHLDPVREAMGSAQPAGTLLDGEGGAGARAYPPVGLPDDCPVRAVGTEAGKYYFLSALGELRELKADQVANKHIVGLFAPRSDYLMHKWPRKKEVKVRDADGNEKTEWVVTGWRTDDVSMLLMDAAASKGVWNSFSRVRGRGGWIDEDGGLVLHTGDRVMIEGKWRSPDMFGGMVYPTQAPSPRPDTGKKPAEKLAPRLLDYLDRSGGEPEGNDVGSILLALFERWNFRRKRVDPWLLLGWNAIAPYGAALGYRPILWLTGDAATGKSKLQEAIGGLHGEGILQSPDATEASVRQILGQQSLPVAIDEAEAEADNRKLLALVKLARLAATSQGTILRGGQDHQGHEFRATSCFLFSSILIPPIPPQDRSRTGVLELEPLPAGAREPPLMTKELVALAGQMRRIMVERWPLWSERLEMFRDAMIDTGGHGGRAADQFGSLLAGAHLLLSAAPPSQKELRQWAELVAVDRLSETANRTTEAGECIDYLTAKPVNLTGFGAQRTVSEWLLQAMATDEPAFVDDSDPQTARAKARSALDRIGIAFPQLRRRKSESGEPVPEPGVTYVAIASSHEGLASLFRESRWNSGGWSQALGRAEGALKDQRQRISGRLRVCTLVPVTSLVTLEEEQAEAAADA